MGRADEKGVLMGCQEPLALDWRCLDHANRGMPVGISRCSRLCYGWGGGLRSCRGLPQGARNVVGPGDALGRAMHVGGSRDLGGMGASKLLGVLVAESFRERPALTVGDVVLVQQDPDRFGRDLRRDEGWQRQRLVVLRDGRDIALDHLRSPRSMSVKNASRGHRGWLMSSNLSRSPAPGRYSTWPSRCRR